MGDTLIRGINMAENYNINHKKNEKETEKGKVELSNTERKEWKEALDRKITEFDLINSLIEEHLDEVTPKETDAPTNEKDPLEMKQSFNDTAKINRERMQRIGLLKSDPTGKNIKASGEDI